MTFQDDLDVSILHRVDKNIGQTGLDRRVEMEFRLLKQDRRALGNVTTEHQNGQDLRHTETDVCNEDWC
jgi:hypothetical protein